MKSYPHILRAVQGQPWAVEERFGQRMLAVLERKLAGIEVSAEERAALAAEGGQRQAVQSGAVMVLPVFGLLSHRADLFMEMCGGTSIARLQRDFRAAVNNPDITAIVMEFDSGGGSVSMIPEFGDEIRAARGTKPIIAVVNTLCASAAYWLASQCDEIVITKSGDAGSIGVFMLHLSTAKADEEEGYEWTLIKAGKYKAEGLEQFKFSEEAATHAASRVEDYYTQFTNAVAKGRGVTAKQVREGFGEGRCVGATEAVSIGLCDRIGTMDDVLAKLVGKKARGGARAEGQAAVLAAGEAGADLVQVFEGQQIAIEGEELTLAQEARKLHAAATAPRLITVEDPAAREGAAGSAVTPLAQAAKAKESTMDEDLETGAKDPGSLAVAAERKRTGGLTALAKDHKDLVSQEQLATWINDGTSVQAAKDVVFEKMKAASAAHRPKVTGMHENAEDRPFESLADQVKSIVQAGMSGGKIDPRLRAAERIAAASGMSEGIGSDGGFAIVPDFATQIMEPIYETGKIMSRITQFPASARSNGLKMNVVDETSRVTGSRFGGLQMYWKPEADAPTPKKLKLRQFELNLKKLIGAAYLTEELREDGPQLSTLLESCFRQESEFMLEAAVIAGNGGGEPLGIKNSPAKVTVAIEGTQTKANTSQFISKNVSKMLARIPAGLWGKTVFLYNQSLLPDLVNATIGTSSTPVFMPPGGLSGAPYGSILGCPAIPSELCEAVGTPGDLYAVALSEYIGLTKGGTKMQYSIHVKFLEDEEVLKITTRFDGAPVWKSAVTPFKGSDSWSPIVVLDTRS